MDSFLLDTHTLIWYLGGDKRLSQTAVDLIEDVRNEIKVSIVSYWEMSIKISLNKLTLPVALSDFIQLAKEKNLPTHPISEDAVLMVSKLPYHHKDPFDRILIAHALSEGIPLIGNDSQMDAYGIQRLW